MTSFLLSSSLLYGRYFGNTQRNNSNGPFVDFLSLEKLSRVKSLGWEVGDIDFIFLSIKPLFLLEEKHFFLSDSVIPAKSEGERG